MKAGIYLGPRKGRLRPVVSALCWLLVPVTIVHVALRVGEWRERAALRAELAVHDGMLTEGRESNPRGWDDSDREHLARLRAALDLDVIAAVAPTEVLRLLEASLPARVVLVSVSIEPLPPRPALMLEAVAESAGDVTRLQESVAGSARVARTQLLEERRTPDGALSVRLRVDLVEGQLP